MNKSDSELSVLSYDDYASDKTYDSRIWKENHQVQMRATKKNIEMFVMERLDRSLPPSKSLEPIHFIVSAVVNSWFQYKQDAASKKKPPRNQNESLKI
ncbi:hypothetical protein TNCV_2650441 [Trichonephila clavipes]|nr:hypothetical protein TNCV_2650441 [Trichonephila clavipes]